MWKLFIYKSCIVSKILQYSTNNFSVHAGGSEISWLSSLFWNYIVFLRNTIPLELYIIYIFYIQRY